MAADDKHPTTDLRHPCHLRPIGNGTAASPRRTWCDTHGVSLSTREQVDAHLDGWAPAS